MAGFDTPLHAIFIRAPRFGRLGLSVEVLARRDDEPVLVRQGRILAATFHPELTCDLRVHGRFLEMVEEARDANKLSESSEGSHAERRVPEGNSNGPATERRRVTC